ncbi:MAG TPA: GtrA family protein [Candidatus Saccharimonadales bacterium]|nr:GtrA family protein [Candidatus Saccharimonadales bacterium]
MSRYFVVGVFAFATDYAILLICYYLLNVPLKLATSLGFLCGFLISFSMNRKWVFSGKQQNHLSRQIIEYFILVGINYLFTVWAVSFLYDRGIKPFIGKIIVMGIIMCWNYACFRWIIFAANKTTNEI